MKKTGISPTRSENYSEWYQQVIRNADLAENAPVRGCMVIKPWGYAIWDNLKQKMDTRFKETGHQNAYFPLFIPLSYLEREAAHVEGFAKECAVVTHTRLQANDEKKLIPCSPLEEPLIVRPTSETIIGESFSRWVKSYRDLPLLINQWANVVRWEMRPRLFLRTSEFLWQEGHTAHANAEEAKEEAMRMLKVYRQVVEDELAIPVVLGEKTASERFPGAVSTFTMEAMMQDGKALQFGTSHFLGQNFSRAMKIEFVDVDGQKKLAWTTSWGSSTRMIGGLIMIHSDDDGLVLPPRISPCQAVILPIVHDESKRESIEHYCDTLAERLRRLPSDISLNIQVDKRDLRGGEKRWQWIKKGVCCLIEVGAKEVENQAISFCMRDQLSQKQEIGCVEFVDSFVNRLQVMQQRLFERAKTFRENHMEQVHSRDEFYDFFKNRTGFAMAYWSEDEAVEAQLKEQLKVTVRCLPLKSFEDKGRCIFTGKENCHLAVFARSY